ncbi:protein TIME FOR COFFEE-like [Euphorbia lathyris]|uniref:protein TIME FOR COFFEE-like n=1 Tax=Euphorbia lathyris TaxID=212925 RepID=UPI0033137079
MSMASWPIGLPHIGENDIFGICRYMTPLQVVLSMDGNVVPSAAIQAPHLLFNQPRLKRWEIHCYIARNIHYHQQLTRINPLWSAATGSTLQYEVKACNVNVVPFTELRGGNSMQDKGQHLAIFPGRTRKEMCSPTNIIDIAQRK